MGAGASVGDEVKIAGGADDIDDMFGECRREGRSSSAMSSAAASRSAPLCFKVSLDYTTSTLPFALTALLPKEFVLRLSYESLDLVQQDSVASSSSKPASKPIIQFPYQNIICWGHSLQHFQFRVINNEKATAADADFSVVLLTSRGHEIEKNTMDTVLLLMKDMKQAFVTTKDDFGALVKELFAGDALKDNFHHTLEQFAANRSFTAKQALDLMTLVSPHAPFERIDLAIFLFSKIINKDSYQLIVNSFAHKEERDNLLTRLRNQKLQERCADDVAMLAQFSIDAALLPERAQAHSQ